MVSVAYSACVRACKHGSVHACARAHAYNRSCTRLFLCACIHPQVRACIHTCVGGIYVCVGGWCWFICTYPHVSVYAVCMYVSMYVWRGYIRMCGRMVWVYLHIYTYTHVSAYAVCMYVSMYVGRGYKRTCGRMVLVYMHISACKCVCCMHVCIHAFACVHVYT